MQVNKQLQKHILEIVDNQLRDNTPPQINITFKALKKWDTPIVTQRWQSGRHL